MKRFKRSLKHFALNSAESLGLVSAARYVGISPVNALYVLVYHRVDLPDAQPQLDPENLSATPEQFDQHMRLIANEYQPVNAETVLEAANGGKKLPPRAVLVTVDDGYRDFKTYVHPIASRYKIQPTLFVPTAYAGSGAFWWDQLYDALNRSDLAQIESPVGNLPLRDSSERRQAFARLASYMKQAPFDSAIAALRELCRELVANPLSGTRITLDWDELRELSRAGVTVAPHTHTHPALGNIPPEQARFEISESQRIIQTEIGSLSPLFAYSYGVPEAIRDTGNILRELGCQLAFTMSLGRARLEEDDRMYLPRIYSSPQLTFAQHHIRLNPMSDSWNRRRTAVAERKQ